MIAISESSRAVFLSYASEDAQAAGLISEALRAAGIEVWFDQSELRGGDAWDAAIRKQIKSCALFVPIISETSRSRAEGYFRLEWKLAVDRSHLMAEDLTFLLPVVIDGTPEADSRVPEKFHQVQWSKLPGGVTPPAFVERVSRLISVSDGAATIDAGTTRLPRALVAPDFGAALHSSSGLAGSARTRQWLVIGASALGVALVILLGYGAIEKLRKTPTPEGAPTVLAQQSPGPASFSPPPHSIAVLPFVNMSGDPKQEYFSDGLSEELLNSLASVPSLQVTARTSSFSFKGKEADVSDIAHKLNVGAILEGSIRKEGEHVRITAQLVNAVTGFHLWSQTYDRDLKNTLALETEIATAVTRALQAKLLADAAAAMDVGDTRNPKALDAYLRGVALASALPHTKETFQRTLQASDEAIQLDPHFAKAYVQKARGMAVLWGRYADSAADSRKGLEQARAVAQRAVELAPDLGRAHTTLADLDVDLLDFSRASSEYQRAAELSPGDAWVLAQVAHFYARIGRFEPAIALAQHAIVLDPINTSPHAILGTIYFLLHRYHDSIPEFDHVLAVTPTDARAMWARGFSYLLAGDYEAARKSCDAPVIDTEGSVCKALLLNKLNRPAEAQAEVAALKKTAGEGAAFQYAQIYAQWGDMPQALGWIETAYQLHDPGLEELKTDPFLDPLRNEPRFKVIERKLNFPT